MSEFFRAVGGRYGRVVELSPSEAENDHSPTTDPAWHEAHRLDAVFPAARVALSLLIAKYPRRGHATFHGAMLRLGEDPVVVVEFDVPIPSRGWEIRASGLWADHICETPMDHWSYGLEAFGLAIDNPGELLGSAMGQRVPLGWELEFEARAEAQQTGTDRRYGQIGSVHGLLLEKDATTEVDGYGVRSHWWGSEPPSRIELGEPQEAPASVMLPTVDGCWTTTVTETGAASVFTHGPPAASPQPGELQPPEPPSHP